LKNCIFVIYCVIREVILKSRDFLSISDLTPERLKILITRAMNLKDEGWNTALSGKILALLFDLPSARHRASFEVAMRQLGGQVFYMSQAEVGLGKRESVADVARVISGYVDCVAVRTPSQQNVETFARYSRVPVINSLTSTEHPCQALADVFTIYEKKGSLEGLKLAYVGDGNNVAHSLMLAAAMCGMNFSIASPRGYQVNEQIKTKAQQYALENGAKLFFLDDPREAVTGADVVYTDVWTSMGQEAEAEKRRAAFAGFQVNQKLLALAHEDAVFMHDLPAHRGEEVTDDVMDGEQSIVFDQSENKMHVLKALLTDMLGGTEQMAGTR
jgi:ornithine carbamoyltransferase